MAKKLCLTILSILFLLPGQGNCETAQSIIDTMLAKKKARERNVESYMISQETAGVMSHLFYEKNKAINEFYLYAPHEITADKAAQQGWTPNHSRAMMGGMALGADKMRRGVKAELGLGAAGDPAVSMLGSEAVDLLQGPIMGMWAYRQALPTNEAYAQEKAKRVDSIKQGVLDVKSFGEMATLIGTEELFGKTAYLLKAENLNKVQRTDDGKFTIHTVTAWIEDSKYVPLRLRIEGVSESGGKSQAVTIERDSMNYTSVDSLYLPFREIMRIKGAMTPKQEADMKRAQAELERMQDQLQGPQKEMILSMMGPQLRMLENMAKGGGAIEVETRVAEVKTGMTREQYVQAMSGTPVS